MLVKCYGEVKMVLSDEQQEQLIEIHSQLGEVQRQLGLILNQPEVLTEYNWHRRLRMLCDVLLKGGVVTYDEWGQIGQQHGYDRRGLGGFFVANGTMREMNFDGKKSITDEGVSQVKSYLNGTHWSGTEPTEEDLEKYASLTKTL